MLAEVGSIASAPMARLNLSSVRGDHVRPASVDRHTPADAVPTYRRDGVTGSTAMARTRPVNAGYQATFVAPGTQATLVRVQQRVGSALTVPAGGAG